MAEISRKRLEFATELFLMDMRRSAVSLNPEMANQIKLLAGYPPEQRSALMSALAKAIKAVDPASDGFYQAWQDRQNAAAQDQ